MEFVLSLFLTSSFSVRLGGVRVCFFFCYFFVRGKQSRIFFVLFQQIPLLKQTNQTNSTTIHPYRGGGHKYIDVMFSTVLKAKPLPHGQRSTSLSCSEGLCCNKRWLSITIRWSFVRSSVLSFGLPFSIAWPHASSKVC